MIGPSYSYIIQTSFLISSYWIQRVWWSWIIVGSKGIEIDQWIKGEG